MNCSFDGCDKPHCSHGLCQGHYVMQKRTGRLAPLRVHKPRPVRLCDVPGCGMVHASRGMCTAHDGQRRSGGLIRPQKGRDNAVEILEDHAELIMYSKQGQECGRVLLDLADVEKVRGWRWYAAGGGRKTRYAAGHRIGAHARDTTMMHRLLLDPPAGMVVDHWDGNGLNNRRSNIRVVTTQENSQNRKMDKTNTSGHRGAYWSKQRQTWYACVQIDGMLVRIGDFDRLEDAAKAAHEARVAEYINYQARARDAG